MNCVFELRFQFLIFGLVYCLLSKLLDFIRTRVGVGWVPGADIDFAFIMSETWFFALYWFTGNRTKPLLFLFG